MWLSDRRRFLLGLAALPVAGCGFRPLYGAGETGSLTLGKVAVASPEGRLGFYMRERLDRRLGGPVDAAKADYLLKTDLEIVETGLAITEDNAITRYRLNGVAKYELFDNKAKKVALQGEVASITAYSATSSLFATWTAERDAERRIAEDLAERIALRVAAMEDGGGTAAS